MAEYLLDATPIAPDGTVPIRLAQPDFGCHLIGYINTLKQPDTGPVFVILRLSGDFVTYVSLSVVIGLNDQSDTAYKK